MDFEKLSAARYSLRKFDSRPVEQEKLALILEAGRNAPTAHNKQPQRMFVIQSPEALEKADACMAPALLVVLGKMQKKKHLDFIKMLGGCGGRI